jgi:hypothetical protein
MSLSDQPPGHSLPRNVLQAAAEHIALPPKLPQEAVGDSACESVIESAICALAVASAHSYASQLPDEERCFWERMVKTLEILQASVAGGSLDRTLMLKHLRKMRNDGAQCCIRRERV